MTHYPWRYLSRNNYTTISYPFSFVIYQDINPESENHSDTGTWYSKCSRIKKSEVSTLSYPSYLTLPIKRRRFILLFRWTLTHEEKEVQSRPDYFGSSRPRVIYNRGLKSGAIVVLQDRIKFYQGKEERDRLCPLKRGHTWLFISSSKTFILFSRPQTNTDPEGPQKGVSQRRCHSEVVKQLLSNPKGWSGPVTKDVSKDEHSKMRPFNPKRPE